MARNRIDLGGRWTRSVGGRDIDFVDVPGSYAPLGECVLERTFAHPGGAGRAGTRFFLVTEGVLARAVFTLNGAALGAAGPWARYSFEIPPGLLKSTNVLQARVTDLVEDFGPTPGRRFDAGLVRDIYVEERPGVFIEDIVFRADVADDGAAATCHVAVETNGTPAAPVRIELAERDTGRVVARTEVTPEDPAQFTVEWPHLWSPARPHLYVLTATPAGDTSDVVSESVGFRKIEARGRDFYLNGERLFLKGVCRHEFTHASGYSPPVAEVRRELARIRHAGFNYIRLVHSPQAACVCRIAAELGILVSEEPGTCFHDLGNAAISAPALECLRRTVRRDRNVPSIFAWLIYNECNPNQAYAARAAGICRELDPGCLLSMADCSGRNDDIKAMAAGAGLSFYGINTYSFWPNDYVARMKVFTDLPLVITEWGGCLGQGNARVLKDLCAAFVLHSREGESDRVAGCSFWAWADYEEHSRPENATIDGWTIEGLVGADGNPKPDLQQLSTMCFEIDNPPPQRLSEVEVLCPAPRREGEWETVRLDEVAPDQAALESAIDDKRRSYRRYAENFLTVDPVLPPTPRPGRLLVDGIEFACRDVAGPRHPLLLGEGCEEIVIPVHREVEGVAVLGHVALKGGYPFSTVRSVHGGDVESGGALGELAAEYLFEFEDGTVVQPLRHGFEVLRANDICRWWTPSPRAPFTRPAVRAVISKTYEVLRIDLWERSFGARRRLSAIRWRLKDRKAILALWAVSVARSL